MRVLKALTRVILGKYELYRILELTPERLTAAKVTNGEVTLRCLADATELSAKGADTDIRRLFDYAAPQSRCFVAEAGNCIVAACWFWYGATYQRRNFWPLAEGEAKLVQVNTAAEHRNRGIAQCLIGYSSRQMFQSGFGRLYARAWHSNTPSLRAFARAGWHEVAFVVTMEPFGQRLRACKQRTGGFQLQLQRAPRGG